MISRSGKVSLTRRHFSIEDVLLTLLGTSETIVDFATLEPSGDVHVTSMILSGDLMLALMVSMPVEFGTALATAMEMVQPSYPCIAVPSRCVGGEVE